MVDCINTSHAADMCRRPVKNCTKIVKNFKIVEFHECIWNLDEKCNQISTNMPGIDLVIGQIDFGTIGVVAPQFYIAHDGINSNCATIYVGIH